VEEQSVSFLPTDLPLKRGNLSVQVDRKPKNTRKVGIMKTKHIVSLLAVTALVFSARAADPKETIAGAVKALKEKANYSWSRGRPGRSSHPDPVPRR
jgi:hypothetical protein